MSDNHLLSAVLACLAAIIGLLPADPRDVLVLAPAFRMNRGDVNGHRKILWSTLA